MDIDTDLVGEIAEALEVTSLQLTPAQVLQLLEDEDELANDLDEWGTHDTAALSQLVNLLSQRLLKESWPTFGDERTGRDVDDFTARLHAAARVAGTRSSKIEEHQSMGRHVHSRNEGGP